MICLSGFNLNPEDKFPILSFYPDVLNFEIDLSTGKSIVSIALHIVSWTWVDLFNYLDKHIYYAILLLSSKRVTL
jgi:hypothetical protein